MDNILYFNTITQPKDGTFNISIIMTILAFVLIIFLAIIIVGIIHSMKNTALTLTENEIIIKSMFYGRKIPLEEVIIDEIKPINLEKDKEYNISIRTNGISVPKFKSGWMKLKNGKKALTFITDKNNVVLIPTEKYLLLFSMDKINEFIIKINEIGK
jgi:heme/copper-type cytochrome/quinol oxidase subunit 2